MLPPGVDSQHLHRRAVKQHQSPETWLRCQESCILHIAPAALQGSRCCCWRISGLHFRFGPLSMRSLRLRRTHPVSLAPHRTTYGVSSVKTSNRHAGISDDIWPSMKNPGDVRSKTGTVFRILDTVPILPRGTGSCGRAARHGQYGVSVSWGSSTVGNVINGSRPCSFTPIFWTSWPNLKQHLRC